MKTAEHYRICPICEAACGLRLSTDGTQVLEIRANDDDVFSSGHVCAKGIALSELHQDPDRIRTPLMRKAGELVEASWADAYAAINQQLQQIIGTHGRDSVATYIGNPTAHNIGLSLGLGAFVGTLGSKNLYSAGSVDQIPKQFASELMFGNDMAIPVPDILHCDYFLMLGANPVVSNGSLWMVPKIRDKIRALKHRGGRLVTVDPRRTETARVADQHHFIRPGTDAWLLAGLINCLRAESPTLPDNVIGTTQLFAALDAIDLTTASQHCGIPAEDIQQIATALRAAEHPVVYGRVGTTLQAFGTLTSFLIEVVNLLSGSLDQRGGAMFPEQPFHAPKNSRQGIAYNRFQSRVSAAPEVLGQLPVSVLAEEIETPGEGQIKGLVCFAGNPVLSNPDSDRLSAALDRLDFLVCIDIYHNETSRKADVVLPGSSAFEEGHYDQFLGAMGYKNAARFSPAVLPASQPTEWDIGLSLGYITQFGTVPDHTQLNEYEDNVVAAHVSAQVNDPDSGIYQRDVQQIVAAIGPDQGVERILDVGIRAGRWGDHFGQREGLTLSQLEDTPNGVDLGEIREHRLNEVIRHADHAIDLAPNVILDELNRLAEQAPQSALVLIGRRTPRSNNTWLRNLTSLTKGGSLCKLLMHQTDATELGLADADQVKVQGPAGVVEATLQITADIAPGVVCLPHGFDDSTELRQRQLLAGPNYNRLAGLNAIDQPTGTAALNGIPVSVARA